MLDSRLATDLTWRASDEHMIKSRLLPLSTRPKGAIDEWPRAYLQDRSAADTNELEAILGRDLGRLHRGARRRVSRGRPLADRSAGRLFHRRME
jgi:hypothetical protein